MAKPRIQISDLRPADLVDKIGISRSYASELLSRGKSPSLDIAVKIEAAFGIAPSLWLAANKSEAA